LNGYATVEENNLLKKEVERLKVEAHTVNSTTNDHLVQLRNEIEELKVKLKIEIDARKAAQKLSKELQMKNDKLRLRGNKKFDGRELEDIQKRYHNEARKELEEKLAQVSQFLAQQNAQNERLEQIRSENLQNEKLSSFKRISDLESELNQIKSGNRDSFMNNDESRYQKLYRDEVRARERSDSQFKRMEKKFQDIQHRFDQERATRLASYSQSALMPTSYTNPNTSYLAASHPNLSLSHNPKLLSASMGPGTGIHSSGARRYSPTPQNQPGAYSRMQDVVDRANVEPFNRSSPLQRI